MATEKPMLFVRRASGLTRAISSWTVLFFGVGTSFLPWHYFLMTALPSWFPGVNLPLIYLIGGALVFVECLSMSLVYVAVPRSGSIYVPLSRAGSPMLGVLEVWRSCLTNPIARGITAFLAAGQIASLVTIVGALTGNPGLESLGASLSANPWNLVVLGIFFNFVGLVINILGPGIMGKWVGIWGAGSLFGIVFVNILLAGTSAAALPGKWDATFGAGAYDEVVSVATANGFTETPVSWGATTSAMLFPVSNTWPYTVMPVVGEVERPRRNIPLSMAGSAAVVLVVNSISAFNFTSTYGTFGEMYNFCVFDPAVSAQFTINSVMPTDLSAYGAMLSGGSPIVAGIAAWSPQWSNFVDVTLNDAYTSRPLFAAGMDRMGPSIFTKVHPRFHSPYVGDLFWFIMCLPTLTLAGVEFATVNAVVSGITFVYGFVRMQQHWSELSLPFSNPDIYKGGLKIEVGGFPVMSILGGFSTAMFIYLIATNPANPVNSALMLAAVYAIGAINWIYFGKKNVDRGIPPTKIYGELPPE